MGTYVNPACWGFKTIRNAEYVDKSMLLSLTNAVLRTPQNMVCITRPRRFGKSYAAELLCSYYSVGCDSRDLFADLQIASHATFEEHLNAYNVIRLDMTDILTLGDDVVAAATRVILQGLAEEFPNIVTADVLTEAILQAVRSTGRPFVFLIDEWDAPIRERDGRQARNYIEFLRYLFKNASFTAEGIALAYLTGILPIRRYNTQSAISAFREYTMIAPDQYASYVGFTQEEVRDLCARHDMSFDEARRWYDGYELPGVGPVYAPFSVMRAVETGRFGSYWTSTAAYDSLQSYIERDFGGLQEKIARLVAGDRLPVDPHLFENDLHEIRNTDDVFTVLVHLGYLAFDLDSSTVRVPNEEVRNEFSRALKMGHKPETMRLVQAADKLLADTLAGDEQAVAAAVAKAHESRIGPDWYNNEQALRFAIKLAYLTAIDEYAEIEELPSGHGVADVVYLPKRYSELPAMIVELKWNKPVESAIDQALQRNYPKVLKDYGGPIVLVGISYDAATKEHSARICRID